MEKAMSVKPSKGAPITEEMNERIQILVEAVEVAKSYAYLDKIVDQISVYEERLKTIIASETLSRADEKKLSEIFEYLVDNREEMDLVENEEFANLRDSFEPESRVEKREKEITYTETQIQIGSAWYNEDLLKGLLVASRRAPGEYDNLVIQDERNYKALATLEQEGYAVQRDKMLINYAATEKLVEALKYTNLESSSF